MMRALRSLGKRNRDSASEARDFDGAVTAELPSRRPSLRDAQRQTDDAGQHTTSRVHATSQATPRPINTVAANCCYFCRGRGGYADQECVFTDDDPRCTRCIRDKQKRCRQATAEEIRRFEARCERCKIRGFKQCNGQRPHCDTCERNNTPHLCWRPRMPQASATNASTPSAVAVEHAERPTPVRRSSRKRRKVEVECPVDDTASGPDVDIEDEQSSCPRSLTATQSGAGDMMHTDDEVEQVAPMHVAAQDEDIDSVIGAGISRSSSIQSTKRRGMSTDGTSATEDDEAATLAAGSNTFGSYSLSGKSKSVHGHGEMRNDSIRLGTQRETQDMIQVPLPDSAARPRRSQPRVSYVIERFPEEFSDQSSQMNHASDDDDSDAYESIASAPESVLEEEYDFEDAATQKSYASDEGDIEDGEELVAKRAIPNRPKTTSRGQRKSINAGEGKGIDFNLPPIDSVEDAFADMAAKAIELGLDDVLGKLKGRRVNVATMCSGTESPLLAFDLLSKALVQAGHQPLHVQQKFAAEIEVFKQAFIERNQSPEKMFRDVRDFIPEDATTAITAYGAEEPIPAGLDVLIAGFVCKDLSRLNSQQKSLDDNGESGDTWRAIYGYAKRFRPSIVLLENVKGLSKLWDGVVALWDEIGYEAAWLIRDTKRYRIPQTRERMYMIAIERSHFGKDVQEAVLHWQELMDKLQRQCSSPYEAWLKNMLHESSEHSALGSEVDWALCKLRYDHIRSDERLGILRPVTKWSENGTLKPPDFANRAWYNSQSSRVYDAIDVAYLQAAQQGHDPMYKMAVWDVSQNVDRFKTAWGILPCITPGGCDFATNRQEALSGKQLLLLQGMPLNKLIFGTETQKECQDLAGNAMTTTVIGASIISAIICGWRAFRHNAVGELPPETSKSRTVAIEHIQSSSMRRTICLDADDTEQLNLEQLKHDASMSARLCNCEGEKIISKSSIRICSGCGHMACASCAGNPKHCYEAEILPAERTQTPNDFVQKWRPTLATRFKFSTFPDFRQIAPAKLLNGPISAFVAHVESTRITSQHFSFRDMSRQHNGWTVTYRSANATLEFRIRREVEWLLFIDCPTELAGNDSLRILLSNPVARAKVTSSLLNLNWELCLPSPQKHKLHITCTSSMCSSWRNRLGLLDYQNETIPMCLQIESQAEDCKPIVGDFDLLPDCGTASGSLYKRRTGSNLYLFLDPNLLSRSDDDCFVFSEDCSRKSYGEGRISLAEVRPSWRPWSVTSAHDVQVTITATWIPVKMDLELVKTALTVSVPANTHPLSDMELDCSRAVTIVEVQLAERLSEIDIEKQSWILERAKRLPSLSSWQPVSSASSEDCVCAPVYPRILWSVDEKGFATPHEARKAAAAFERAIKTRVPIFHVDPVVEDTSTQIRVAVNVAALVHRARGRLACGGPVDTAWCLFTDHAELPNEPFAKFRLLSNAQDTPFVLTATIAYLRNAQPRALTWMKTQELGKELTITEVEEAIHTGLGWRAEARAQATLSVRGGVLADLPSFGKTVTTIALIQSEFDEHSPDAVLKRNQRLNSDAHVETLLDSPATLIVCPGHIALQWRTELEKFLGERQYDEYNVIVVQTFADLQKLSIDKVLNSRVVVVSWSVFAEEEYISHLAHFAAMPEPSVTGRRAFDTWFNQASQDIPQQLSAYRSSGLDEFRRSTQALLEKRLQHEDFKATLPLKVQHGSAYQSFNSSKAKAKTNHTNHAKPKTPKFSKSHQVPLLHLFRFNRVVVDEYHYLNDDKKLSNVLASVSVKRIAALKRWVLSGTPALSNFSDVDQIASYLGIRLGRYHFGDGVQTTLSDKMRRGDQTLVEEFLSQTETMSRQWHKARHERAQEFLDMFVRRNEPCLGHVACVENIVPSEIDIGHLAVYLELLQYVGSHGMAIRKLKNKTHSDRVDRLNASLSNSATAEDALLKCALLFRTSEGKSALHVLTELRSSQRESVQFELRDLMARFEGLVKSDEISDLYDRFKQDITEHNWLGDAFASRIARNMLIKAQKSPDRSAFPEMKGTTGEKRAKLVKKRLSSLRETARDLSHLLRSERFITAIQALLQPLVERVDGQVFRCSCPDCDGKASLAQLHLITHCGHTACETCLSTRIDADKCIDPMCSLFVQGVNLVKVTDLGSRTEPVTEHYFGRKMEDVKDIISKFPKGDQGVIFAPNDETVEILEEVLDSHNISYHSLRGSRGVTSAKIIEDFKTNDDPDDQSKVLILNMGSESAAGANLVNANHLIFVAPLLAKTQYEYDSAMAQAIARLRRYMQTKTVHIYHIIAQRTIDVDILEHRHKRVDGITTSEFPMEMLGPLPTREKTKLVKNNKGQMALVPVSWLADRSKREVLGVDEAPESFASLIAFSDQFQHDDDDDD